jgi:glycine hydroxymethyltransferase
MTPSGLRLGTPAMTTRGFVEKDFEEVVEFMERGVEIARKIKKECGSTKVVDFKNYIKKNEKTIPELVKLKNDVISYASQFEAVI